MRFLLDTNILIYSVDANEPDKRARATALLQHLGETNRAVISAQILAEFANAAMRKLNPPLSPDETYRQIERYEQTFLVLALTPAIVLEAVRGVRDYQLAYYDAQIWAAARLNQIPYVLSEDFNADATLDGVTFLNPFTDTFDLDSL